MKYKGYAIFLIVFAIISVISGATFAYRNILMKSPGTVNIETVSVSASMTFKLDETKKGIPGEEMVISKENTLHKPKASQPIVFKIEYEILNQDKSIISNLSIKDSEISNLIRDPKSSATKVIYYGTLNDNVDVTKKIGNLYAEFGYVSNNDGSKPYDVKATFVASQKTEAAIKEVLGVDPVGDFSLLLR